MLCSLCGTRFHGAWNRHKGRSEALAGAQKQAYNYLYAGSIILGLGNGTVEAFINPVVATMFHKETSGLIFYMQYGQVVWS